MTARFVICLLGFLSLVACDQTQDKESAAGTETDATALAESQLADQSYEDVRGTNDCTDDCSGHNAGWDWARDNDVTNPDNCSGNSDSFVEGCKAYGEELQSRISQIEDGQDSRN